MHRPFTPCSLKKKMFTSAVADAFSLVYNNRKQRLIVLQSELQLACFLNMDSTDIEILIFSTRTHCSNDDSWSSHSTIGSRRRNNKVSSSRWALLDGLRHPYLLLMASVLRAAVLLQGLFYQ